MSNCKTPENEELTITKHVKPSATTVQKSMPVYAISNDVEFKKEVACEQVEHSTRSKIKFSANEDQQLARGIEKYGKENWSKILNDSEFQFHECRNRDSLRMRCETSGFKKNVSNL